MIVLLLYYVQWTSLLPPLMQVIVSSSAIVMPYVTKTVARAMPGASVENGQRDRVRVFS